MSWREHFNRSKTAVKLEMSLKVPFRLIEHEGGIPSTANTDVSTPDVIINLDISQDPLKCALSYAYELKNLDNASKYIELIGQAKNRSVNKTNFIKGMIQIEAEAVYFRCLAFFELGQGRENCPFNIEYLNIVEQSEGYSSKDIIAKLAQHIFEIGIVRRQFSAVKYYADSYDYHAGKRGFPSFYDETPSKTTLCRHEEEEGFVPLVPPVAGG